MPSVLPRPPESSIIFENERVYVCLALYPITRGHTIVVWKKAMKDLSLLSCDEYEYLMNIVDIAREALVRTLHIAKAYLLYMDEVKHVHWHIIPRFNERGLDVLLRVPQKTSDFSLADMFKKTI